MLGFLKSKKNYIVFDIGSKKIASISFSLSNKGMTVKSIDHQISKGIKKNKLLEIDQLSLTLKNIYKKLSKKSDNNLVFCNITDPNVISQKTKTSILSSNLGITKKQIRKIFRKSLSISESNSRRLIHSDPSNFIVDEKNVVSNPIGYKCSKLDLLSFNVLVDKSLFQNLNLCFNNNKILVQSFFDSGVASAEACLSSKEKEEGSVCIDIGCETTKVVVFVESKMIYISNISVAGSNVTSDVSQGLNISFDSAELAKIMHGTVSAPFNEKVEIEDDSNKKKIISKNLLFGIIKPRYEEILEIIRDNIFDNINARIAINSVVLTGGASKIFGIQSVCENIFNRKTRIGNNENNHSFFYNKPEFSTLLGMIKLAKKFDPNIQISSKKENKLINFAEKLENWIEESYV